MEPDFSGYATKNDLVCSDGRTIVSGSFKHQDGARVPLVWEHRRDSPGNVLGYAVLEHRADGVYARGYFNETDMGKTAKELVKHGDIKALSIFANQLVEKGKQVLRGMIGEVSLVYKGANPGASIDYVNLAHGEGTYDDEAIIYTGLELEHGEDIGEIVSEKSNQEIVDSMTPEQQALMHSMVQAALGEAEVDSEEDETAETDPSGEVEETEAIEHAAGETVQDVFDGMSDVQKKVVFYMIDQALAAQVAEASAQHSEEVKPDEALQHNQEGPLVTRNAFDTQAEAPHAQARGNVLSHSAIDEILEDAKRTGSLRESFLAHADVVNYGIENINLLFPDAKNIRQTPDFISRRMEWVSIVLNETYHTPFARIKSTAADITAEEARAKGYVKGNYKKEEVIKLLRRITEPTTVYKKQKLDRDDITDITDLDVVAFLRAEMRMMLDEEIARAILIGDGRMIDDPDKINEDRLRPIAYDDNMYAHQVNLASAISPEDMVDEILRSRTNYKGTGTPDFFTHEDTLTDMLLIKDRNRRRVYANEAELAAALRVRRIVPVEVMSTTPDLLGIIVNLADYTIGADKGGEVNMFDDFDIDYNQQKYLIETRISGALTKPKSAVVIKQTLGTSVTPTAPTYDKATHVITIPTTTGVDYKIDDVIVTGTKTITETTTVEAFAKAGYSFPHGTDSDWTFVF